ncbi:MAG TPA: hypothetical protein VFF79_10050 [Conexibacter sp.]|jgi:hypothetical protein|nr:hypothetical protein [Conexibacter sp.]
MRRRSVVLAALVVLAVLTLSPAPWHIPSEAAAAGPDSQLVRAYPLGERPLCCRRTAAAHDTAPPGAPRATTGSDTGAGRFAAVVLVLALALAVALGFAGRRFRFEDGAWVRMKPRRRLRVGPTVHRRAQSCGFRYSTGRDALVPRALGGRFGPVLALRPSTAPPPPVPAERAPDRRQPEPLPDHLIDVACRRLPHQHHGAVLWQLTAVELRTRYVWAELLRRRGGPPTASQISAFLHRIAGELSEAREPADAIAMLVHALPVLSGVALPVGIRLVVPDPAERGTAVAAEMHELLVARHWRSAFVPPAAPPLDDLRRRLRIWVAAHNAQRDAGASSQLWLPFRMTS